MKWKYMEMIGRCREKRKGGGDFFRALVDWAKKVFF